MPLPTDGAATIRHEIAYRHARESISVARAEGMLRSGEEVPLADLSAWLRLTIAETEAVLPRLASECVVQTATRQDHIRLV